LFIKGTTYGPFAPDAEGQHFGTPEKAGRDLEMMAGAGINLVRVYYGPPKWFLDACGEHGIRCLISIPWAEHIEFLNSRKIRREVEQAVEDAVTANLGHPAVFGFLVGNEIPSHMVRWLGPRRVTEFLENLIHLANRHPRVNILQPGAGVGGHCIAVDPWFIVARDEANARLIRTAREVNNHKTDWVIDKIKLAAADANARTGRKPTIACLGLAFKPDIDDLRESPALHVAQALQAQHYNVVAVEPNIETHAEFTLLNAEQALEQADVLAILVKHRQFVAVPVQRALRAAGALDFCGALRV
jgi:predicted CoA-binding protein